VRSCWRRRSCCALFAGVVGRTMRRRGVDMVSRPRRSGA
jgi:hypothetical protein